MKWIATVLASIVAAFGAIGLFWPEGLLVVGRELSTPNGIYVAAGLRILFGMSLLFSARESRAPHALRLIGVLVLIAGIATPVFGSTRAIQLLDSMSHRDELWLRFAVAIPTAIALSI